MQNTADLIEDAVQDLKSDSQAQQYKTELQDLREGVIVEVAENTLIAMNAMNASTCVNLVSKTS